MAKLLVHGINGINILIIYVLTLIVGFSFGPCGFVDVYIRVVTSRDRTEFAPLQTSPKFVIDFAVIGWEAKKNPISDKS